MSVSLVLPFVPIPNRGWLLGNIGIIIWLSIKETRDEV